MSSAEKFATYEDLFDLPPHTTGQIVCGVLHVQPRPALAHVGAATGIGEALGFPFRRGRGGPGGWIILHEPELHLDSDILVPDLAGWRRAQVEEAAFVGAFVAVAPQWVCEVLSPSTARLDRGDKLEVYRREGVQHVWLVDPILQMLEILRLDGPTYRIAANFTGGVTAIRAEPFDAIELDLAAIWRL
jgi:Putative restriction endonuclease